MANQPARPILVCNVGWMARYKGLHKCPDKIVGGGRFVRENDHGHECCNFKANVDGLVFGHFETIKGDLDRSVNLQRLGAKPSDNRLKHVDVVWVATDPTKKGRRVIGYYLDATVYRNRQRHVAPPTEQHRADGLESFMVIAHASNASLLSLTNRRIRLGDGKGWIGQANWWYPELSSNPAVRPFLEEVRQLLKSHSSSTGATKVRKHWGGPTDPLKNALVEAAAIDAVRAHFSGCIVESVEKDNLGWDLHIYRSEASQLVRKPDLCVEVKGLSSHALQVGVTHNECKAVCQHISGNFPTYRLCVVTGALSQSPTLFILRNDRRKGSWINENSDHAVVLAVEEKTAAIISLL